MIGDKAVQLLETIAHLRASLQTHSRDKTVGFVPTMGGLHAGHLSLLHRARQENDIVVASIFVNPLQFAPGEDFDRYPRPFDRDRQLCREAGVDLLFAPSVGEMYPLGNAETARIVPPATMTTGLCGRSRPGHFEGVATAVTKLLQIVRGDRAYFGQKDAQQLAILRRIVTDLNIPVQVVGCAIVREPSGLAYSSRNHYLSETEKQQATVLYRSLTAAETAFTKGDRDVKTLVRCVRDELATVSNLEPDYIELVHPETLMPLDRVDSRGLLAIAARLGSTRLIDNIILRSRRPIIAIDGPAGAGKSTVTRLVARRLGLLHLDSGAMYRAVTWRVLDAKASPKDEAAVKSLLAECHLEMTTNEAGETQVAVNGKDITREIRGPEVTANVSAIAAMGAVREFLVAQQQRFGELGGLVAEGRDIGTQVFPDAEVKIFLTASVGERAKRRQRDLQQQGQDPPSLEVLEAEIARRDELDSTRTLSPLRKAKDAIEIQTDNLTIEEAIDAIISWYRAFSMNNYQ